MLTILQKFELEMLQKLDSIFKKNEITYWLAYGSVLGAVRHNGFIPWDDDVDIYILGSDYKKLKELFLSQNTGTLELHDSQTVKNYPFTFPKVVDRRTELVENRFKHLDYKSGVYIDIFLLFPLPNNPIMRFFIQKWQYLNYSIVEANYCDASSVSGAKAIARNLLKFFNSDNAQRRLYSLYTRPLKSEHTLGEPLLFSKKLKHKSEWFKGVEIASFEGTLLPTPWQVKDYLISIYGDYMTFPPVEERVSPHDFYHLSIPGESD